MLLVAGVFSLGLGVWHFGIPSLVRYREAIGPDGAGVPSLGAIPLGPFRYELRRHDLVGIAWVMSNAASYVLISIGLLDLRLALASPDPALRPFVGWIAGWWALRAVGQGAIGRRPLDLALAGWFAFLAVVHLIAIGTAAA